MANRSTLAVSRLDDFIKWLKTDGWDIQATKGFWEVLRAVKPGRKRPIIIYKRIDTNSGTELVHYTVENRDMGVVRAFLNDSKRQTGAKQIKMYHIAKVQHATIRLFEAQDENYPDMRVVRANERAIQYWLDKITKDEEEQRKILDVIERQNWNMTDSSYKPICNELRKLGYEVLEGVK